MYCVNCIVWRCNSKYGRKDKVYKLREQVKSGIYSWESSILERKPQNNNFVWEYKAVWMWSVDPFTIFHCVYKYKSHINIFVRTFSPFPPVSTMKRSWLRINSTSWERLTVLLRIFSFCLLESYFMLESRRVLPHWVAESNYEEQVRTWNDTGVTSFESCTVLRTSKYSST